MPDTAHSMITDAAKAVLNVDAFTEELDSHSAAAVPVYLVRTREPLRCAFALQDYANREETDFKLWQCNTGWQNFADPGGSNSDAEAYRIPTGVVDQTADMVKALAWLCKHEQAGIYTMMHPHSKLDNNVIQQFINDVAYRGITRHKQRLVLIVPDDTSVPVEIDHNVHIMHFRSPSHMELRNSYNEVMLSIEDEERPQFTDAQIDIFIQNGIGMTAQDFGTAISLAAIAVQPSAKADADWNEEGESEANVRTYTQYVLDQKIEAIKKTNILSIIPPVDMSQVGGMDLLKEWLQARAKGFTKEARDFGLEIPKGMLAVGPPGSGKSLFAKAVSSVFRVPLVVLDVGKIFDKYVGNSEGKMRAMLALVEDMAPCVLLVDEIDKGFGGTGGGGDGGVSKRVLGTFLTWLQERDKETRPVYVVMTANNVTDLPPELFRKGRIDEIFAVTFPSDMERAEILKIHLSKRGHEMSDADLRKVAAASQNFVGAELEAIVSDGLYAAFDTEEQVVTADILIQQRHKTKSLFEIFPDKVRAMLEWAKNNAKPASSGMSFEMPDDAAPKPAARQLTMRRPNRPMPPRGGRSMDS